MVLLGASVTVAEFSTALPYLGALSLLAEAQVAPATWASLLVGTAVLTADLGWTGAPR